MVPPGTDALPQTVEKRRWTAGAIAVAVTTTIAAGLQIFGFLLERQFGWFAVQTVAGFSVIDVETVLKLSGMVITLLLAVLAILYAGGAPAVLNHIYTVTNDQRTQTLGMTREELQAELNSILGMLFSNQFDELGKKVPAQTVARIKEWLEKFQAESRADLSPITAEIVRVHAILDRIVNQEVARIPAEEMTFLQTYADNALRRELEACRKDLDAQVLRLATVTSERDQYADKAKLAESARVEGSDMLEATKPILDGVQVLAEQIRMLKERSAPTQSSLMTDSVEGNR